jgi:prepilin peptidase CpaA
MTIAAGASAWLVGALILLLTIAALEDGWRLRISNLIVLGVAATGAAAIIDSNIGWGAWQPILLSAIILVIGTPMFAAGWIGGGDIKLLAASGLWFTLEGGARMMIAVAIAGGLLALVALAIRRFKLPARLRQRVAMLRPGSGVPYGIAVAAGVTMAILAARPNFL